MNFQIKHTFAGHSGAVYALAPASTDQFYSAGSDRVVALWDINLPEEGTMVARATDIVYSICNLQNGKLLIGQAKGEVHVVDAAKREEEKLLKIHESPIFQIVSDRKHGRIYMLAGDGSFSVHDENDFSILYRIKISTGKLRSIAFHPLLDLAVIGCGEGVVQFFDTQSLHLKERVQIHKPGFSVNALTCSPNGQYLLSGSRDAHLNVTDISLMKTVESIPAHNYAIYAIAYHPNGNTIATASRDKTIKLWNADFEIQQRLDKESANGHVNSVNTILWMNENLLLSGGDDRAVIGWEAG
jgi:WD40 repeat protein